MGDNLIEEMSPFGNIVAYAQDDGQTVYFYLYFRDADEGSENRFKACWVRNRKQAPAAVDRDVMMRGAPPFMPARFCRNAAAGPALDRSALRIVWFEEADAAALVEGNSTLAVIPGWSGTKGFCGYARDCVGESQFAWELTPDSELHGRIARCDEFWGLWNDTDFWDKWRTERIAAMERVLGPHSHYYAIDGGEFPPRAMLRFDLPKVIVFVTVGVSLFAQPRVEQYFDDPSPYRRMELAACLDRRCPEPELTHFAQYVSAQARYPWSQFAPLGAGHTMPCDSTPPKFGGERFDFAMFSKTLKNTPKIQFPAFRGDPINLLWVFPITSAERDIAVEQGTNTLLERLTAAGFGVVIQKRRTVDG